MLKWHLQQYRYVDAEKLEAWSQRTKLMTTSPKGDEARADAHDESGATEPFLHGTHALYHHGKLKAILLRKYVKRITASGNRLKPSRVV